MGLDVTFHAISEKELHKFVFGALSNQSEANKLVEKITNDEEKKDRITNAIYNESLFNWYNGGKDSDGDEITSSNFPNTFSFAIAILSGYLHPFWYSRNGALTLAKTDHPEIIDLFTSFSDLLDSPLSKYNAIDAKMINSNYSASGVITDVSKLKEWINNNDEYLSSHFEEDGYDSLKRTVEYCIENDLYFLEGADIAVPFANQCFSDWDNLKAHFLNKL